MRSPFYRVLMVLILPMLLMAGSIADAAVAEVSKAYGDVVVFHAGERKSIPVVVGLAINLHDIVRTGNRSRTQLKFSDGTILNIGSLAKIQVDQFTFDADKNVRKSVIRNLRGKMRAAVSKSKHKGSFFRIKTPGAVAAVRGTDFVVDVISPHETVVLTYEGAVSVSNVRDVQRSNAVLVLANQITRVVASQPPTTPVKASPLVLLNMAKGTNQVQKTGSDSKGSGSSKSSSSGKSSSGSNNSSSKKSSATSGGTGKSKTSADKGSTTTTTTGKTTSSGVSTTTTTTTVSDSGGSTSVTTSSHTGTSVGGVNSASSASSISSTQIASPSSLTSPASMAPVAMSVVPSTNNGVSQVMVVVPQTTAPTVKQAPVVNKPAPVTPPVTVSIPVLKQVDVNIVFNF